MYEIGKEQKMYLVVWQDKDVVNKISNFGFYRANSAEQAHRLAGEDWGTKHLDRMRVWDLYDINNGWSYFSAKRG